MDSTRPTSTSKYLQSEGPHPDTVLRVCFIASSGYLGLLGAGDKVRHGGAELQAFLIARELSRDPRFAVSFLFSGCEVTEGIAVSWATVFYDRPPISRGLPLLSRVINAWRLRHSYSQTNADVYFQAAAGQVTATTVAYAHLTGARFLYWVASDGDVDGSIIPIESDRQAFLSALPQADIVVSQNRYQQSEILRRYGKESTVISNLFPMPDAPPVASKEHVLWVASAQNLKQPWVLLNLARAFPHERFVMVMPTNDLILFERIKVEALAIPNLDFSEGVPFDEIQDYFERAKVFINTSWVEGFPNTFVQAAMGATPVLSLNVNPDDVLTEHGFGRVAEGDEERLRHDLGELLLDDELRERMGAAGFDYARRTHDIEVVIEQVKGLLWGAVAPPIAR